MDFESHSSVLSELNAAFYHLLRHYEYSLIEELNEEFHQILNEYDFEVPIDRYHDDISMISWESYVERDGVFDQQIFAWEMARLEVRDDNIEFFNRPVDQVTPLDISLSTAFVIGERLNHRQSAKEIIAAVGCKVYISLVEEVREGELRDSINGCSFAHVTRSGRRVLYVQGNGVQWKGDRLSTVERDDIGVYVTEVRDYPRQVIVDYIANADCEQPEDPEDEDEEPDVQYVDQYEAALQVWQLYEDEQLEEHEGDSDFEAWLDERNERMLVHYEEWYNSYERDE